VRIDSHVYAGYRVPPYYDSLLGKVIAYGATREEALGRARQALEEFIIEGVHTTIPFLREVLTHEDFVAGDVDTHFLEHFRSTTGS
jgi:acetyl-CoA carboxylase biotin carboxylase subunit